MFNINLVNFSIVQINYPIFFPLNEAPFVFLINQASKQTDDVIIINESLLESRFICTLLEACFGASLHWTHH